jgi:flavin reductase (DIM6/NTAB) family NADH-FMN oxidoreductase RutF
MIISLKQFGYFMKLQQIRKVLRKVFKGNKAPTSNKASGIKDLVPLSPKAHHLLFGSPIVLCGSIVNGKPNFNTLSNFGILYNGKTPVIYIASECAHYTNIGIHENSEFSIGFPDISVKNKLDYCGVVSGHNTDKSTVFPIQFGMLSYAPIITECPVSFACKVTNHLKENLMDVFIAEVIERYAAESIVYDEVSDRSKIKSLALGPGNTYRVVERKVGIPWLEYQKVY